MPRTIFGATLSGLLVLVTFNTPALAQTLSITLGDVDGGINNGPGTADDVYSDLDWRVALFPTAPSTWPFVGFDFAHKDSQVPFTFDFAIDPDEIVTAATLTLAIRGVHSKVFTDGILLDDVSRSYSYTQLGWNPVSTSTIVLRSLDLTNVNGDYLIPTLQDGKFNVAVRDDTLVDYARLDLTFGAAPTGDLNGDGFFGIADLNIVLGNWNQNVTPFDPLMGDPSGDGLVGIEDLNFVLGNWNAGVPPAAGGTVVIPEPGALGMMMVVGVAGLRRRDVKSRA
jgi:hypothetical protein